MSIRIHVVVATLVLLGAGCGSAEGEACCVPEAGVKTRICHPTEARRVIDVDSCGNEVGGGLTCGGKYIWMPFESGANCGCPLVEPKVLVCHIKGAQKADEETTLGYLTTCNEVMPEAIETCLPGERCWQA